MTPSDLLCQLAGDVRHKTLQILQAAQEHELLWTPSGTSNHILWHAGHCLWVNDALCIELVTGRSELPGGWSEMFRMGTRPTLQDKPWPDRREIGAALKKQLGRLQQLVLGLDPKTLAERSPHSPPGDDRTLGECILHGLHDEANHQGEMYLLLKMQRLAREP